MDAQEPQIQRREKALSTRDLLRQKRRQERQGGPLPLVDLGPLPSRDECRGGQRPCPHARCRHHLGFNVTASGSLQEVVGWETRESCSLDVAEKPMPATLEEVGTVLGVTRERARQVEEVALGKLRVLLEERGLDEDQVRAALAEVYRPSIWDRAERPFAIGDMTEVQVAAKQVIAEIDSDKKEATAVTKQEREELWAKKTAFCTPLLQEGATYKAVIAEAKDEGMNVSPNEIARMRQQDDTLRKRSPGRPARSEAKPRPPKDEPEISPPPRRPRRAPAAPATASPTVFAEALRVVVGHLRTTGFERLEVRADGTYLVGGTVSVQNE